MRPINGNSGNNILAENSMNDNIFGYGGNDQLFGFGGSDTMDGGDGNDYIAGGLGNDIMIGGTGTDVLIGGEGNDFYFGGTGLDYANFVSSGNPVHVDLSNQLVQDTLEGLDSFSGIEGLQGSAFGDFFRGNDGDNFINGAFGSDVLFGDAVRTQNSGLSGGADVIDGGNGDDLIDGGGGNDRLYGGAGADHFVFERTGNFIHTQSDIVADFNHAQGDRIDLSNVAGINSVADVTVVNNVKTHETVIHYGIFDEIHLTNVQGFVASTDIIF